jgi:hypothetical protein
VIQARIRVTGSTLAQQGYAAPAAPYRWRGTPGWDPAAAVAERTSARGNLERRGRLARLERFTELRAQGMGVTEAGAQLGLAPRTARGYEADRTGAWRR